MNINFLNIFCHKKSKNQCNDRDSTEIKAFRFFFSTWNGFIEVLSILWVLFINSYKQSFFFFNSPPLLLYKNC